jgi:branched-chain amino acid transport system permease protein
MFIMVGLPIQGMIIGLSIGSSLFLIALGLSLIFGVLDVLNFAHGALYMVGAYVTITVATDLIGNFWIAVVVAALAVGLLGMIIEVGFIRRVYDRTPLDQLIITFALVLVITDLTQTIWGSESYTLGMPDLLDFNLAVAGGLVPAYRLFTIGVAIVSMVIFWFVFQYTHIGRLVQATSSDRDMASLLGVNVPRLYTGVFFAGSALAGFGGALAAPLQAVTPGIATQVIIDAFIVVVIGGLGSFIGAFIGAMFIGFIRSFGVVFFPNINQLLPFVAMILVLVFRPEGLFGEGR